MLVNWGVEQAKKANVPAYLEALAAGAPVYAKCGFRPIGEISLDLSAHGFPDPVPLWRMAATKD